jgi:DNA-directed RNA polymerase specialized sigma24 family protein
MKNKNRALLMLTEHHQEYIKMAKAIAGNSNEVFNYAEDFVQEAYLKLAKYDDLFDKIVNKNGKVSKGYMFFCLRSIILNHLKKKSNLKYNYLGSQYDFEEKYNHIDEGLDQEKLGIEALETKMYRVLKEEAKWFDYELFKTYITTGKSFRTLAEESKIGIRTIYLSIKRSKVIIAEKLFEDYQDFVNEDYDLI